MLLESAGEIATGVVVEVAIAGIAFGMIYRLWGAALPIPRKVVVPEMQTAVVLFNNKVESILTPGTYRIGKKKTVAVVDLRPRPLQIANQDIICADGMGVRMTVGGEVRIIDPGTYVLANTDSQSALYLETRLALRNAVSETESDPILRGQTHLLSRVNELILPRAAQLGLELSHLSILEAMPLGRMTAVEHRE